MHAGGIWCKTKIQIDHGGLEVNFSLQVLKKRRKNLKKHLHYSGFSYIMAFVGGKQIAKSQQMEP